MGRPVNAGARPVTGVGVVGCGRISPAYLLAPRRFANLSLIACADVDDDRARQRAKQFGVPRSCPVDALLADERVEIVVNLTPPREHHPVSSAAVAAGKSVYVEKPLAADLGQAREVLDLADRHGVRVGCSPDTFLSPVLQACRALVDQGAIGTPVGAVAFHASRGPHLRHPDPGAFYRPGGGPLLDIGPYYLTALVSILGPVRRVSGAVTSGTSDRIVMSGPRRGTAIPVDTPTHVTAGLEFASGVVGTLMTSFDVWSARLPRIEIYGTDGSLSIPDPDGYHGVPRLFVAGTGEWRDVPVTGLAVDRGVGLADLAQALRVGRPHRADGELAYHVLEVSLSVLESARIGSHVAITSRCVRPDPVPPQGVMSE